MSTTGFKDLKTFLSSRAEKRSGDQAITSAAAMCRQPFAGSDLTPRSALWFGPIYIGPSNVEHIRCKHPVEFVKHLQDIPDIIENPDYIGVHPRQGGVEFVRMFEENGVMVSVRPSAKSTLFVRSIYAVTDERVQSYLQKGTLIRFEEEC